MITETVTRLPGRPREFDRNAALRRAMEVFWAKGFQNTSIGDLTDAIGINAPSLYAAFGNKESLFREAVGLYADAEGGASLRALRDEPTGRAAIEAMLKRNIEMFTSEAKPRGCMIVLSIVSLGPENEALQSFIRDRRTKISKAVKARLTTSATHGELPPSADIGALTTLCMTVLNGLSLQALDGISRSALFKSVDVFVASLGFRNGTTNKRKV